MRTSRMIVEAKHTFGLEMPEVLWRRPCFWSQGNLSSSSHSISLNHLHSGEEAGMGWTRHTQGRHCEDGQEPESVHWALSGGEADTSECLEALEGVPLPLHAIQMQIPLGIETPHTYPGRVSSAMSLCHAAMALGSPGSVPYGHRVPAPTYPHSDFSTLELTDAFHLSSCSCLHSNLGQILERINGPHFKN